MFDDGRKKVDLRGKSKSKTGDRQAVLAKAAREREERQRQRQRLSAATMLQAKYRARLDLRRVRNTLRASFDAALTSLDAVTFAEHAPHLTRDLLLFHQHCEPSDARRRQTLLSLLLQSAASPDPVANACARLCVTSDGMSRWLHHTRRLAGLSLPHLLAPPATSPAAGAPAAPPIELRMASYSLDASAWTWATLLPPASAHALPRLATAIATFLTRQGLFAHATAELHAVLPAAPPPPPFTAPSPLVAPLLALIVRGVHAATSQPSPAMHAATSQPSPAAATPLAATPLAAALPASAAPMASLVRDLLCDPAAGLTRVPPPLLSLLFAPAVAPLVRSPDRSADRAMRRAARRAAHCAARQPNRSTDRAMRRAARRPDRSAALVTRRARASEGTCSIRVCAPAYACCG